MLALIQRVSSAKVEVGSELVGEINQGLLVFLGIEKEDNLELVSKLLKKVLSYRVFSDADNKMNLSLTDINGGLLIVSQFTLAADTNKGLRPSFSNAKPPEEAQQLYNSFVELAQQQHKIVASGEFGADMNVSLLNDGPVTFILKS